MFPTNKTDDPLYNSRIISIFMEYLDLHHPRVDNEAILAHAGITPQELRDQGHWLTQRQIDRFHEKLSEVTGDPDISRKVGRYAVSSKASGVLKRYTLGLMNVISVYMMMENVYPTMSRGVTITVKKLGRNKVEIITTPKPGVKENPDQCKNRIGTFESVGKLFTDHFSRIEHPACINKGDGYCRYIITWDRKPSIRWRRVRDLMGILGIPASAAFFLISPIAGLLAVLSGAILLLAVSYYAERLDREELARTVETQGNAAKSHLDEINIRYNNALLVQEIGQASSTILDIDELVRTVVGVMEKRLDFDRGLIMLTNKDRSRLRYAAGYGYSEDQERLLKGTEFHLDNPDSRGIFVLAFREQRTFLVNDISKIEKEFSRKSLELARRMDVRSLICIPIIYEKESLGILAVDNVRSRRNLTQSDVSLLTGVASQMAVSIVNAISFRQLRESEAKYRELVENANSMILRRDIRGNITFINEFAQRFFGYTESEIIGKNLKGTILPDTPDTEKVLKDLVRALQADPDRPFISENENILRDGKTANVAWTYKPIFNDGGTLEEILCIGNDITRLKQAAREKDELEAQLREAQKMEAVGTLAGGIAHDFNNILQAILSYAQLLLMKKEPGDPESEKLEAIQESARRASDLTKRLLIFSRKVKSKLRPLDLNQEVVQVSKMLERTIPKMIRIELKLSGNLSSINADPVQIEQIMMNLGVNARDAMPEGGTLTLETRNVRLAEADRGKPLDAQPGEYVLLTVSDTGHGMDGEVARHIFEPFFTTKETGKGTGLGLAMVYGIVKNHGGHISCDTAPDRGTVFSIYFPVTGRETREKRRKDARPPVVGGDETVLLVDDDETVRQTGEEILSGFGYKVLSARDGEEALAIYREKKQKIDLVILDLIMPGMGGKRCLMELLEINPEVRVIITTGYSAEGKSRREVEDRAVAFLNKPYSLQGLLQVVRNALDGEKGKVPRSGSG